MSKLLEDVNHHFRRTRGDATIKQNVSRRKGHLTSGRKEKYRAERALGQQGSCASLFRSSAKGPITLLSEALRALLGGRSIVNVVHDDNLEPSSKC